MNSNSNLTVLLIISKIRDSSSRLTSFEYRRHAKSQWWRINTTTTIVLGLISCIGGVLLTLIYNPPINHVCTLNDPMGTPAVHAALPPQDSSPMNIWKYGLRKTYTKHVFHKIACGSKVSRVQHTGMSPSISSQSTSAASPALQHSLHLPVHMDESLSRFY
jgi:hypothetical protein